MKNHLPAAIILLFTVNVLFFSCLKDKGNDPAGSLQGKWSVVSDSSSLQNWGLWSNKPSTGSKYSGRPGDYYLFTTNMEYSKEDTLLDTNNYRVNKDTLFLTYTDSYHNTYTTDYILSNFTYHTVTLTSFGLTPETAFTRIIKLQK
jgi:hypothetical protein